jgi:phosphoglucosamine mutase
MMEKLFGTDGIRGKAGAFPLDKATVRVIGRSLASHLSERLGRQPSIVVGRDSRESGVWLEEELIRGAMAAGAECKSAGLITTPGVAFLARILPADVGVVISASHNPYYDNGIKVFASTGQKLDDAAERLIEADIFAGIYGAASETSLDEGFSDMMAVQSDLQSRYLEFLTEVGQELSLQSISLVVDCANGAASSLAPLVFERLGARVIAINNAPDGRNINLNCGSLHMDTLSEKVVSEDTSIGVAFDGDADRALFIDRKGQLIDGDATLWVLAKYLQAHNQLNQNVVVATVMSNIGLEIALRSLNVRLIRTDVGDKYVLDQLLQTGASLGGEQSGHIIYPRLSLAGDGIITTLLLLRCIVQGGRTLDELTVGFEKYPQILLNVKVREKPPFQELGIEGLIRDIEGKLGNRGRLLLRYSGTEPLARVMIEGESQSEIDRLAHQLASAIQESVGSA